MSDSPQQFTEWLAALKKGSVDDELTMHLRSIVQQVFEVGKPGEIHLKLKITKEDGRTVTIAESVTAKEPVPSRSKTLWYPDEGGDLHRDDPYQERLDLRDPTQRK